MSLATSRGCSISSASSDFVLTNNTFRNNDFGHAVTAPDFGTPIVPGLIVDGAGNVCTNSDGAAYPLVCH